MSEFVLLYLGFSGFQMIAGVTMIVIYSISYPWWRDPVGRMMVIYAGADLIMALLLCVTVVFKLHPVWFRSVWFVLQTIVGCAFVYQARTIACLRRQRAARAQHRDVHQVEEQA